MVTREPIRPAAPEPIRLAPTLPRGESIVDPFGALAVGHLDVVGSSTTYAPWHDLITLHHPGVANLLGRGGPDPAMLGANAVEGADLVMADGLRLIAVNTFAGTFTSPNLALVTAASDDDRW